MKLIKLHTTESTNSFLKELAKETVLENFTVVVADEQSNGRGQVENSWESKPFKNLTFSVFVVFDDLKIKDQKFLNYAVSLAIFEVVLGCKTPNLKIKWPNDILSEKKKICGILIENQLKQAEITSSVIGIGLNVNQTNFEGLPNATSLKNLTKKNFDLDDLIQRIIEKLKDKMALLNSNDFKILEADYLKNLYKFQKPSMFKDKKGALFMGKIVGVSSEGKLQIELEDELVKEFGIKEIKFI